MSATRGPWEVRLLSAHAEVALALRLLADTVDPRAELDGPARDESVLGAYGPSGELVGALRGRWPQRGLAVVDLLGVLEDDRHEGVGTALLDGFVTDATERGASLVGVRVAAEERDRLTASTEPPGSPGMATVASSSGV